MDQYLEDVGMRRIHPRTLILLGIGANDFFDALPASPIESAVPNAVIQVERLLEKGARHLVLITVPDLSKTPAFSTYTPEGKQYVSYLCSEYNTLLVDSVRALKSEYFFNLTVVDAYSIINDIISNPQEYGLLNTTIPVVLGGDPENSLFFDYVHPTTAGHRILADYAVETVLDTYTQRFKFLLKRGARPFLTAHLRCR